MITTEIIFSSEVHQSNSNVIGSFQHTKADVGKGTSGLARPPSGASWVWHPGQERVQALLNEVLEGILCELQARLDRVYVSPSIKSSDLDCQAFDHPSFALGTSDHRPVPHLPPWRVDNRLFNDETAKASLRNRLAASLGKHNWDALKQEWKEICTDEGKKLRHRYSNLVRATFQRIRIVERGKPTTLLMKSYVNDLKQRLARQRALRSTTASSYQARYLPSSHPEVLNYLDTSPLEIRNTELAQELLVNSGCEAPNSSFPWVLLTPSWSPGTVQDMLWRFGWAVLPTAGRMYKWHYVPTEQCVDCREHESIEHSLFKCRSAVTFWSLEGFKLVLLVCSWACGCARTPFTMGLDTGGTSLLGVDAIMALGLQIDGSILRCL
ncbi:hypothetical protein HPB50_003327 [Hyalomma asiaticum]|uniref:Uncharacterized protein n=1 Tax=Hyalomma asiaticum TaxID=266040 RepID=A0ACB7S6C0_HYAAI|nr:hypothetical protein HPB50_003327 [Hyalomma asiaticum]